MASPSLFPFTLLLPDLHGVCFSLMTPLSSALACYTSSSFQIRFAPHYALPTLQLLKLAASEGNTRDC